MTDSNERYEVLADLYHHRYGELAPGKDRPAAMGAQSGLDISCNESRWKKYLENEVKHDAADKIIILQAKADLVDELVEALENFRMYKVCGTEILEQANSDSENILAKARALQSPEEVKP